DLPVVVTLAGAVIGFLRYNFNPAKVFMGDTGSMFLGFMLGSYALTGATRAPSLLALTVPVIAMGLPLIDTALAVVRRFLSGKPMFVADRDHIHHRTVNRLRMSHRGAVLMLYSFVFVLGVAAFGLTVALNEQTSMIWPAVILILVGLCTFMLLKRLGYISLPGSKKPPEAVGDGSSEGLAATKSTLAESTNV
ncbi:MAG: MraY family glycosyltransferase, partial [Bacteroidota bacterium]